MAVARSDRLNWTRWFPRWVVIFMAVGLCAIAAPAFSQQPGSTGNPVDGYPVALEGKTLFQVREGVPGLVSAQERAQIINQRLSQAANDPAISLDDFRVEKEDKESLVKAGDVVLFTIREADARALDQPQTVLADRAVTLLQTAVQEYREARSFRRMMEGLVFAVLSTIALILGLRGILFVTTRLLVRVRAARQANALGLRFRDYDLLGSDATSYLLSGIIRLCRLILILGALGLYFPFFLSQFPATRTFGQNLLGNIAGQFQFVIDAFVGYLPNLITLGMIVFVTNYLIEFAKLVVSELGREDAYTWFYPEWVQPTSRLVEVGIIVIGFVIGAPYLPGFGTPAFQGVSFFLGALFTLSSSSAVANAIAGVILIYTRAFRVGDVIRIGEVTGKVIDKSLFVTRISRFPQEVVVMPNTAVLNGNVTNFSAVPRMVGSPLILHTTVTLGYDLPWRLVEETFIKAAIATPGVLADPSPFLLQAALNDFNISYQLNFYTDCPEIMPVLMTRLHQNLQDYCNAAGIEIMSPNFFALRDGNHSTIPADYLPADYKTPEFQVKTQNGNG